MRIEIPRNITPQEAVELQQKLAPRVKRGVKLPKNISTIIGCDAAYVEGKTIAAAVAVDYKSLSLQRVETVIEDTGFPYVPGLLAFREGPPVLRAIHALHPACHVCIVDGHGVAHPRKFGLACFVGLSLNRPTIGVAKSLLFGEVVGGRVVDGEGVVIAELMTLPSSGKRIYVSVGHKIRLQEATKVVEHCITPLGPLPIRLAHEEVTRRKWQLKRSNPVSS